MFKDEMAKTIKALNDNFNNELLKQNENFKKMREEMEKANENKIKELTNALKNKDNELKDIILKEMDFCFYLMLLIKVHMKM